MTAKTFAVLVLLMAICGCDSAPKPVDQTGPVIKKTKETIKSNAATVSEAP